MNSLNKLLPQEFPLPKKIKILVCCDLDETYIPFSKENKPYGGIDELEQFLCTEGQSKGIVLGWITGSNLNSVFRKATGYISRSPNFICCSLGTEFYWVRGGKLVPSVSWFNRIAKSGYSEKNFEKIILSIYEKGISIEKQPDDYQGAYKKSYYYHIRNEIDQDFIWIEDLARSFFTRAIFTRCNPAAGDRENCYDVEFIPNCCGKDEVISFLLKEMGLTRNNVLAFGDSCNDLSMFERAGHAYLVSNADKFAIERYGKCLDKPYCHGILSVLKGI